MRKLRIASIFAALALIGGLLYSCSKTDSGISPIGDNGDLKAKPLTPLMTVSYDPLLAIAGQDFDLTLSVSSNSVLVTCGYFEIFKKVDADGNWVSELDPLGIGWVKITNPHDLMASPATYTLNFPTKGLYGIRVFYQSEGGCTYGNITGNTFTMDIAVGTVDCSDRLTITPFFVSGPDADNVFVTKWKIKACESFTNVKTQGGLTANCTVVGTIPQASNVTYVGKGKNPIINWIEPAFGPGVKEYVISFTKTLKGESDYTLTGAWSVVGTDVDKLSFKSTYASPIVYTPAP